MKRSYAAETGRIAAPQSKPKREPRIEAPQMQPDGRNFFFPIEPPVVCVGCGCTELTPCMTPDGPCCWIVVNTDTRTGLCSGCVDKPIDELVARESVAL